MLTLGWFGDGRYGRLLPNVRCGALDSAGFIPSISRSLIGLIQRSALRKAEPFFRSSFGIMLTTSLTSSAYPGLWGLSTARFSRPFRSMTRWLATDNRTFFSYRRSSLRCLHASSRCRTRARRSGNFKSRRTS